MPNYDYKCQKCGHTFEGEAKMNDPCPPCPNFMGTSASVFNDPMGGVFQPVVCAGTTIKQFTSVPPAHFNGGGWAKDGYSK